MYLYSISGIQKSIKCKIKNERMKLLHQRATNLLSSLNDWTFDYIPREKNAIADKYADLGRRKSN